MPLIKKLPGETPVQARDRYFRERAMRRVAAKKNKQPIAPEDQLSVPIPGCSDEDPPESNEGAPRGEWGSLPAAIAQAKAHLNEVCRHLHPDDRAKLGDVMAALCVDAAKKVRAYNDKIGVPERAEGGLRPDIVPVVFM